MNAHQGVSVERTRTRRAGHARRADSRSYRPQLEALEPLLLLSTLDDASLYSWLGSQVTDNQTGFYVYREYNSGVNHGFPTGRSGVTSKVHVDPADYLPLESPKEMVHVSFDPLASGESAGMSFVEPESGGSTGTGYDLRGATQVVLEVDALTPGGIDVQFGVGGSTTAFMHIRQNFEPYEVDIPLASLTPAPPDLSDVHTLFSVTTDGTHTPGGGELLLDNIRFDPVPTAQRSPLGLPVAYETGGVAWQTQPSSGRLPYPVDQLFRNLSGTYDSSLTLLSLLVRGNSDDLSQARLIADTFVYALGHDNHADPLPTAADGSVGLHNGYENGDIAFLNDPANPALGRAGDVRLAGFPSTAVPSGWAFEEDGASGGSNAFAILALTGAYRRFGDARYLAAAEEIGRWIIFNLIDPTGAGYGGYYEGYPDDGKPKVLLQSKSTENNADIYAAFTQLAAIESGRGNAVLSAGWTEAANIAGDFVLQMFDLTGGRFNAGTVPAGTPSGPGIDPTGAQRGGDVINVYDFANADTMPVLAMAADPRYHPWIDWRRPIQFALGNFVQGAFSGYVGLDLVRQVPAGPDGIAWEFTAQAVDAMRLLDNLYGDQTFQSRAGQLMIQLGFSVGLTGSPGVVAVTVEIPNGTTEDEAITTPFQTLPERDGLAATSWVLFADKGLCPFTPPVDAGHRYVASLYQDLLGRQATPAEMDAWVAALSTQGRSGVANAILNSSEAVNRFVQSWYTYFLARSATPLEVSQLIATGDPYNQIWNLLGGTEFGDRANQLVGGPDPDRNFIQAVYLLAFRRPASNADVDGWIAVLNYQHGDRVETVGQMLPETYVDQIQTLYGDPAQSPSPFFPFVPNLLHRLLSPSQDEVQTWLYSGLPIRLGFLASDEYFN
jgi:hypothetical protein